MSTVIIMLPFLFAYLLGCINSAVIISRLFYHDDVRGHGSGNAGTTNMMRTYGAKAAAFTFAGDIFKGMAAVWLAKLLFGYLGLGGYSGYAAYIAGTCAVLGHMFPAFFRFKGGKGVATGLGAVFAINPVIFAILFPIGLAIAGVSGYVSLGALSGAILFPSFVATTSIISRGGIDANELLLALALALLIIYNHRENIKRLINGTENKFYKKK